MTREVTERLGVSFEEHIATQVSQIPVARAGVPADIASAVSYFCREAAGFLSGQVLYVAGGPTS